MQTTTILYLILAFLVSLFIAYFQYYYKVEKRPKIHLLLAVLKTLALFLLILLWINPTIKNTEIINTKPVLAVLVDNSKSISFFEETTSIKKTIDFIKNDKQLQEKFDVKQFTFGNSLDITDSLSFTDNETNIYNAIQQTNDLYSNKIAPILLLTDGNQTIGNNYEFSNSKQSIYPIIFGDTVRYQDLKISQLNVNKYSYINNKFPVEVFVNYDGNKTITSRFSIYKNGKTVYSKRLQFSPQQNSKSITTNLTSTKEGLQYYTASIGKVNGEKNIKNNAKNFSVEVIDEQTKVLLLTSVLHPDLGAFKKAIESNKQRSVTITSVEKFKNQLSDYQLVILYQPNVKFNSIISQIKNNNTNYFLVSGNNSDWSFLNSKQLGFTKKSISQIENYGAIYNDSFLTFLQKDIAFNQLPPLKDKFGEIVISKEHQNLLYQHINGLKTAQPLLSTFEQNNQKVAVLFGEGIWKWRASSFLNSNSFQDFDGFLSNLVQYLASNKKRSRLEVNAESLYPANSTINIAAFYTDKNYKFDARAFLKVTITNLVTNKVTKVPFSMVNSSYQTEIENLPSGDYKFKVSVLGQNINKYGRFKITNYQIEEQFTNANTAALLKLANKTGGKSFYKNQFAALKKELLNNKAYYISQKSIVKEQKLIDWKWILFFIISLFTAEWFIRKYHGKI